MSRAILGLIALRPIVAALADCHLANATSEPPFANRELLSREIALQDAALQLFGHREYWSLQVLALVQSADKIVSRCECGRSYTRETYAQLPKPPRGDHMFGPTPERALILRNCRCGTTLSIDAECADGCVECARIRAEEVA